jgi:hypothetical protein
MTKPNRDVERFDLAQLRADRAHAEAAAVAPAPVPGPAAPDPLARLLDALVPTRPLRRAALPPADVVRGHDPELAALLDTADRAHGAAIGAALDWQHAQPGGAPFAAVLAAGDEDQIARAVVWQPARAWAHAWVAQRDAHAADDAARVYAARARDLREALDVASDAVRDRIRDGFHRARDRKDPRALADARDLAAEWLALVALYRWVLNPTNPYREPAPNAIPADVAWAHFEAATACGEQPAEVPLDAPDAPRPKRPALPMEGTIAPEPRRRGIFGGNR